jgi:hypothetical protein
MKSQREDLLIFYRRYLKRCNEHRFDTLGEFVADDVNGPREELSQYIAGLRAVVEAFRQGISEAGEMPSLMEG